MKDHISLTRRLLGYSASGIAFALTTGSANAAIVFNNVNDSFGPGDAAPVDFNGDAVAEFVIAHNSSFFSGVYLTDNFQGFAHFEDGIPANGGDITPGGDPNALPFGFLIGPGGAFDTTDCCDTIASAGSQGNFRNFFGQVRYLGVRFNLGAGDRYGWIAVRVNPDALSGDVLGYAYEDSGAGILTGAGAPVPEPSSIALMAAGAAGLVALRRRRQAN